MSYFRPMGDIEMPPDFVGKGADPGIVGQPPPPGNVFGALFGGLSSAVSSLTGPISGAASTVAAVPGTNFIVKRPTSNIKPILMLGAVGLGAYLLLGRRS